MEGGEALYRAIRSKDCPIINGRPQLSVSGFYDSTQQPSVDRAKLVEHDPERSRRDPTDAVVKLVAKQVREIDTVVRKDKHQRVLEQATIDVIPDPIKDRPGVADNPAHALIVANIELKSNASKRLREALVDLSEIILPPSGG